MCVLIQPESFPPSDLYKLFAYARVLYFVALAGVGVNYFNSPYIHYVFY